MGKTTKTKIPIREDKKYKTETHVAGICLRYTNKKIEVLVGKRQKGRELFPGKWECGGGQVKVGENFKEALKRQFFEEFGVRINILQVFGVYEIILSYLPKIPGVKFVCTPRGGGHEEVKINPREFSEYKWIPIDKSKNLDLISGVYEDIAMSTLIFSQLFSIKEIHSEVKNIGF